MAKSQRPWGHVAALINAALKKCDLSPRALGEAADISYDAAWRCLSRGVSNKTQTAVSLCRYFKIDLVEVQESQTPRSMLEQVLRESWDGTAAHADLIASLIKSTGPFKISERD